MDIEIIILLITNLIAYFTKSPIKYADKDRRK